MSLVIPANLWEAIREFVQAQRSGRIELEVRNGQIIGGRMVQSIRAQGVYMTASQELGAAGTIEVKRARPSEVNG